jgi:hypothetical protein
MLDLRRIAVAVLVLTLTVVTSLSCGVATDERLGTATAEILVPVFTQQAYVKASNTGVGDDLHAIALSADGNTMAVGADLEDSNGTPSDNSLVDSGAVYIYVRSSGAWTQQAYLKASNAEAGDRFGFSVTLSADGNTLAVAAPREDSNATGVGGNQLSNSAADSGAAYVFQRSGGVWSQQAYIKAFNTEANDGFSWVALSGDGNTLAVGAQGEDSAADGVGGSQVDNSASGSGAVYVYGRVGATWTTQAYIKATNSDSSDQFGTPTLSNDGNTLAVGAYFESSSATGVNGNQSDNSATGAGAVYVYTRSGSTWSSQAYIKASNSSGMSGFGTVSLSGDGNTLAVGAPNEDSNATLVNGNGSDSSATNAGAAYVYTRSAGSWSLHSYVKAPNTEADDVFGRAISLSSDGTMLAVGAPGEDSAGTGVNGLLNDNAASGGGAVYTYSLVNGAWGLSNYIKASNTNASDFLGDLASVALSSDGSTLAVGAPFEDSAATGIGGDQTSNAASASGAVYVFTSTPIPTFEQQAYIKASNAEATDHFAASVAVSDDGNTLVVGAKSEKSAATGINGNQADNSASPAAGAAYVYVRSAGSWVQEAYVKASNTNTADAFGHSVALSADGNTLAVSAPIEASNATGVNGNQSDNSLAHSGAVYVFTRSAGVWTQQAYVKASNTGLLDHFGASLALSSDGNTLAVSATDEDSNAVGVNGNQADNSASGSGAVYVFTRSGVTWSQQAYVKASNTDASDAFGSEVALSSTGDTLAVSAGKESSSATLVNGNQSNNSATSSGAAYVFTRSAGTWTQQAYIKAPNTDAMDGLRALALSADGNTLALGASGEDSNALDVNGSQSNNSASASGAAYIYTRSGSSWSNQAYLKASNTEASDLFGQSLALSDDGNTLAVGASAEASAATGVNGNRSDNSATGSGAVFTFKRSGSAWSRGDYVKASNTGAGDNFAFSAPALSADGATLVVGSFAEDSNATGINGGQTNNSATDSGAAYVYTR